MKDRAKRTDRAAQTVGLPFGWSTLHTPRGRIGGSGDGALWAMQTWSHTSAANTARPPGRAATAAAAASAPRRRPTSSGPRPQPLEWCRPATSVTRGAGLEQRWPERAAPTRHIPPARAAQMGWTSCSCRTARRSALLCALGPQAETIAQTGGGLAHRVQNHAAGSRAVHRAVTRPGESFGGAGRPTAPLFSPERASASAPFLSGQCSGNPLKLSYGLEPYSTVLSWYQPDDSTYENSPVDSRGAIIRTPWPGISSMHKASLL